MKRRHTEKNGETGSDRLEGMAVVLGEIQRDAGDEVIVHRLAIVLPDDLQVHACSLSGEFDVKDMALTRV